MLGVAKTASQDDIKKAYRKLAKKLHPDLNPGNTVAEKKFKEVNSAYDLVGEAAMRAKFDRGETEEQAMGAKAFEEIDATAVGMGAVCDATTAFFGPSNQLNLFVLSKMR